MLGLGYPGGPLIDALARDGDPLAFDLPRGLINDGSFNFSFSGLKTAVRKLAGEVGSTRAADVAASVQRAIVEVLVAKTVSAAEASGVQAVTIAGGVSANSELRSTMQTACEARGWMFVAPRGTYCVDNAAMIGFVAAHRLRESTGGSIDFGIEPRALRAVR
jgi:N6-L-threonylcarbamoyladenine synthase